MSCNHHGGCNSGCNRCDCVNSCGCSHFHSAECIIYKGDNLTCSGINEGDTVEEALIKLDEVICTISPSGYVSIVESCDDNIEVTSEVDGFTTTYTVCLSSDITEQLDENTASIASLSACASNSIVEIVSNTLSIGNEDPGDPCGRVWRIEYNPSGSVELDGIIESNTTISGSIPNGAGGTQLVKSFNHNYSSNNLISDGDRITFYMSGEVTASGGGVTDDILVELFDATGATVLDTTTLTGMFSSAGTSSYEIEGVLEVDETNNQGFYSVSIQSTHNLCSVFTDVVRPKSKSRVVVTGIDYTNLTIRLRQLNSSSLGATNNTANKLVVEVTKKI